MIYIVKGLNKNDEYSKMDYIEGVFSNKEKAWEYMSENCNANDVDYWVEEWMLDKPEKDYEII